MKPITRNKNIVLIGLKNDTQHNSHVEAFSQDILGLSRGLYRYVICQEYDFYGIQLSNVQIFQELDLHSMLQDREVDEVWIVGADTPEIAMGGSKAFWLGSSPIPGTENIYRRFAVMRFSPKEPMLQTFVRRVENTMYHVYRGYPPFKNAWEKFIKPEVCGTVLRPPSGELNIYNSPNGFFSGCEDWLNYPNTRGQMRYLTSQEWEGTLEGYLRWWLRHLPHGIHKTDGIHDNWWHYVMNLDLVK